MKKTAVLLLTLAPMAAAAADQPPPAFPDQKIGLPPLALAEVAASSPPRFLQEAGAWFRGQSPAPTRKLVSSMPIRSPAGDIDPRMVKRPDASTDYKLIVKAPEVEPAK